MTDKKKRTVKDKPEALPVEVLQQALASFVVDLVRDPAWQALLRQVPRQSRRELGRRFGNIVVGIRPTVDTTGDAPTQEKEAEDVEEG